MVVSRKSGPSELYSCQGRNDTDLSGRRIYLYFHSRGDAPKGHPRHQRWRALDFRRQRSPASKVSGAIMRRCLIARHSRCSRTGVPPYGLPLIRRIIQVRRRFPGFSKDGWLNVIGSKHPLPGGVILKEVRGGSKRAASGCSTSIKVFSVWPMACSQESQMHLNSSLTTGFCRQIERAGSGSANPAKWHSTVNESLKNLGRAIVFHRGEFGRSFRARR
jgi:hypothetical protein